MKRASTPTQECTFHDATPICDCRDFPPARSCTAAPRRRCKARRIDAASPRSRQGGAFYLQIIYKPIALYRVATKPGGPTATTQNRHTLRRLKTIVFDNKISIFA
jgi:hypothetical protein